MTIADECNEQLMRQRVREGAQQYEAPSRRFEGMPQYP